MTDSYGKDPHEHETPVVESDAEIVQEPSNLEFDDDHIASATSSDDSTEDAHTGAAAEEAPQGRSMLPLIAALGGVLLLGGAGWWVWSNNSDSGEGLSLNIAKSAETPVAIEKNPAPLPVSVEGSVAPKSDSAAAMSPSEEIAAAQPLTAVQTAALTPPKPLAAAQTGTTQPPVPTLLTPAAAIAALPAAPTPPTAQPADKPAVAPAEVAAIPAPAAAPLPAKPSAVGADGADRLASMSARVDSLQKSLDQVTQQIGQLSNMVAANVPADSAGSKDIAARLDKLEQQVAGRRQTSAASTAPVAAEPEITGMPEAAAEPVAAKPVAKAKKHTTAKPVKAHKPVVHAEKAAKTSSKWVLRAATTDQAWVATDSSSRDLRAVRVGDSLPGLGKVTAISSEGDQWIVKTTYGTIK